MVLKSKKVEDHYSNLEKVFDKGRKYDMSINPDKCFSSVNGDKFFDFMIS